MPSSIETTDCIRVAVLGAGRLGNALASALDGAGVRAAGPYGRDDDPYADVAYPDAVLLCVPDSAIVEAAIQFPDDQLLGHFSGASGLELLGSHRGFSLHPLTAITHAGADFRGVGAAIEATDADALAFARRLATALQMAPFELRSSDRVAYHAAACIASNFLITLEASAEMLAETAGVDRELLIPLVRASVDNWANLGAERALTGPVARGDSATVARQRTEVAARAPQLLAVFDAMVNTTEALAAASPGVPA